MCKIYLALFASIFALMSCQHTPEKFVINGEVSDHSCDGAKIFLVPLTEEATHETVDSVVIKDAKFTFEGTKTQIAALRLQMPQRVKFQELLVYTEPGIITAKVAPVGRVTGTKCNDLLQSWKETQESCMASRARILEETHHDINSLAYHHVVDSLNSVMGEATYKLIKEGGMSPFTRFFYFGNRSNLTDKQRSDLQYMEDDYQHQLDSLRKVAAERHAQRTQN